MSTAAYWIRLVFSCFLGLLFLLCVLGNWSVPAKGIYIRVVHKKSYSTSFVLPFVGPIFGIAFFIIVPIGGAGRLWWTAPLIEPMWLVGIYWLLTLPFVKNKGTDSG